MTVLNITDLDLNNKRVLIRVDFNVPIKNGKVTSDVRIEAALPTIKYALKHNAKVILMSHLGRPTEGEYDEASSMKPVVEVLEQLLGQPVKLEKNWLDGITVDSGNIVICENVRFNKGEKKNNPELAKKLANLCDIFVMDAFATSHRAQASTYGVAEFAPIACSGMLLTKELEALSAALKNPAKPLVAIVGGAKVSTKLTVLENLCKKVDTLVVGGGIANTFLAAMGKNVGASLYEKDLVDAAKQIMATAKDTGCNIPMPVDVRVSKSFSEEAKAAIKSIDDVADDDMILDIGPKSEKILADALKNAKTIVWNGPVGVFEFPEFANGTKVLANIIANSDAFSLAGGGDTIAAIEQFNIKDKVSYISTAGGAFLEFLEGKELPAVTILEQRAKEGVSA